MGPPPTSNAPNTFFVKMLLATGRDEIAKFIVVAVMKCNFEKNLVYVCNSAFLLQNTQMLFLCFHT